MVFLAQGRSSAAVVVVKVLPIEKQKQEAAVVSLSVLTSGEKRAHILPTAANFPLDTSERRRRKKRCNVMCTILCPSGFLRSGRSNGTKTCSSRILEQPEIACFGVWLQCCAAKTANPSRRERTCSWCVRRSPRSWSLYQMTNSPHIEPIRGSHKRPPAPRLCRPFAPKDGLHRARLRCCQS